MPTNWPPSLLGLDTNTAVPSSDSRAAYDAIQLAREKRSADQAVKAAQGESDEKHSQLQQVSKLWGALRQRCSRCVSTGGPLGRKKVRRYVAVTVLVLLVGADVMIVSKIFKTGLQTYVPNVSPREKLTQLIGAGAMVGSKVSKTARQIYMRSLSPKEQLAQTNPPEEQLAQLPLPSRTSKTTPHRNQAAVNKQPGEQLPNLQTTAEQAGSASQGGILERILAVPNKRRSPSVQGDPYAKVWVDTHTGVYLCQGTVGFGKTSRGRYMTQQQARFDGFSPAYEKKCE